LQISRCNHNFGNITDIIIGGGQVKQILIFRNKLKFGEINMISQLFRRLSKSR